MEENPSKTKKYYDYDDIEYKGKRNIKDLFDLSIDKDYYKPIITKGAFNNNYIQYESKGDKGSEFVYDSVDALYYNLNKVSLSRGESYIDSPKCLKNKKAAITLKNNDGKCFQ